MFISSAAVRQAFTAAQQSRREAPAEAESRLPELLVFGTPTCTPCLQFKEDLNSNRGFSTLLRSTYELVWVDIDQRPQMAERYGIQRVPVFLSDRGLRIVGYTGPEKLIIDLGLKPEPDPRPPPVEGPAPVAGDPQPPSKAEPTPEPLPPDPQQPNSDAIDRLTSLTQHAITIATWLGVTGISGGTAGAVLGGLALWRTLRKRRQATPPIAPHPTNPPPTITHDSAPLPQAIVPETRFAAYERDSHAEAFAWAAAEMARKYP